ncbi:hypothetical protein [Paenibacillus motobuensis]|uniref:ABC transporter permease n=1 Tax=Paenibacillus motobuensis TaxID=295324 RepID=A0ABN0YDX7_9BACL
MLYQEWRKILIKQKGVLVIAMMIVLKIALTLQQGYDSNLIINRNPEGYTAYIKLYEGKLTEAKEQQLQEEYYAVVHANAELDGLARQWKDGSIGQEVYEQTSKQYYERIKNNAVFNVVYNQYYYAKEAPEERYLIDERGWSTLLGHSRPDFVLLLSLIIVLTPLFCYEYESGMDALLLSSSKGKYQTGMVKLAIGVMMAMATTVLFTLIEYFCLNGMVGLRNGSFPLQSLEFFANSEYPVTLNQAFLILLLVRMLGAALFAGCISLTGIITKNTVITLFISSVLIFLPYILFPSKPWLYYLPLPSGLLAGTGYLWGTVYTSAYNDQGSVEKIVQFQAIGRKTFLFLIVGYAIEMALLYLYSLKKYSKYMLKRRLMHRMRNKFPLSLSLLIICCLIISGCEHAGKVKDIFTFDARDARNYGETAGYAISLDEENNIITAKSIDTGEEFLLTREPFIQKGDISAIFVRDGWCYYVTQTLGAEGIRIYGIDLKNFRQKLIYNSVPENTEDFFGIASGQQDLEEMARNTSLIYCLVLNENNIYFVVNSELVQINRNTGREKIIARDVKGGMSLVYYNGDIYYIDHQYRLSVYKEQEGKVHALDSLYTDNFRIENGSLHYRSLLDDKQILTYKIAQ